MHYFTVRTHHLGDYWSTFNKALIWEEIHNEITYYVPHNKPERCEISKNMIDLIDYPKKINYVFDENNTLPLHPKKVYKSGASSYKCVYYPTKLKWTPNSSKKICYSFDANWKKEQKTPDNIQSCLDIKELNEYSKVYVGLPLSLHQLVKELSECEFLVTLDNGIAHVARSVGCPMILVQHKLRVERAFPPGSCKYILSIGKEETIKNIISLLK